MAGTPSRTLVLTLTAVTDKFKKGLGDAEGQLGGFGEKLAGFGKKAALAFAAVGVAAGALAVKIGKEAISAASDLSEEISKSGEIFGESAGAIDAWSQTAANAFGQSRRQALQAAANFGIFGKAAGLTGESLNEFSTDFVELASDLASFNNTSPEDAVQALGAALRGEAEPIRRYGILLNDAGLRQKALELGIISTTKEALTPQQRILAAQAAIYEQVGSAAGDFARTSDGLANSQRILAANLEDVKGILGEALLPVAERFTAFLKDAIPEIAAFARQMGEKLGPKIEEVADFIETKLLPAVAEVWPHVRDFAKFVGEVVMGIVEFVREEIAPRFLKLIQDLKVPATDAWQALRELGESMRRLKTELQLANPEGSKLLDWLFALDRVKWDYILGKIEKIATALTAIADAWTRIASIGGGRGFGGSFGDAGMLPEGFVPGQILPSASSLPGSRTTITNVTINGPIDSEGAAREVRKVLSDSTRRTGTGLFAVV
jgi:hypothetical protein